MGHFTILPGYFLGWLRPENSIFGVEASRRHKAGKLLLRIAALECYNTAGVICVYPSVLLTLHTTWGIGLLRKDESFVTRYPLCVTSAALYRFTIYDVQCTIGCAASLAFPDNKTPSAQPIPLECGARQLLPEAEHSPAGHCGGTRHPHPS